LYVNCCAVHWRLPSGQLWQALPNNINLTPCERCCMSCGQVFRRADAVVQRCLSLLLHCHHCLLCTALQGCLHCNPWFHGALAAVSCKQELLQDLIVSTEHAARGLYVFQFFKHGGWQPVVVDDRLPFVERRRQLAFCSSHAQVSRAAKVAATRCSSPSLSVSAAVSVSPAIISSRGHSETRHQVWRYCCHLSRALYHKSNHCKMLAGAVAKLD